MNDHTLAILILIELLAGAWFVGPVLWRLEETYPRVVPLGFFATATWLGVLVVTLQALAG